MEVNRMIKRNIERSHQSLPSRMKIEGAGSEQSLGLSHNMRIMKVPEWFRRLPDNAYLGSKEITQLFGYSENTNINVLLRHNSVPKPDHRCNGFSSRSFKWQVKYLRKFIRKQGVQVIQELESAVSEVQDPINKINLSVAMYQCLLVHRSIFSCWDPQNHKIYGIPYEVCPDQKSNFEIITAPNGVTE